MGKHQQENRGQRSQYRASLKEKKEEYQGKHRAFPREGSAMEKERQALAMTEGSGKR